MATMVFTRNLVALGQEGPLHSLNAPAIRGGYPAISHKEKGSIIAGPDPF